MAGYNLSNLQTDIKNYTEVDANVFTAAILNSLKTKGSMETDPAVRQGIAMAKKDMKKKGFIGLKAKKIPRDLSYMKGYLD